MNKLLLKPRIDISDNGSYFIELDGNDLEIYVSDNVQCNILFLGEDINQQVLFKLGRYSELKQYTFCRDSSIKFDVYLEEEGAGITCCYSELSNLSNNFYVSVYHNALYTSSLFYNHIANFGTGVSKIQVDTYVSKDKNGCVSNQDNKILLLGSGKGEILPNLFVDNYDSFIEHSAYISKFSRDELFYLKSRGISEKQAELLLVKSFLLGKFKLDDNYLSYLNDILLKWKG